MGFLAMAILRSNKAAIQKLCWPIPRKSFAISLAKGLSAISAGRMTNCVRRSYERHLRASDICGEIGGRRSQ